MKGIKATILVMLVLMGVHGLSQNNVKAYARLDSSAIMIGDQINMELGIKIPENFVVDWPRYTDTVTSRILVVKRHNIDTAKSDGNLILSQRYTITSFDSGYFEIPPSRFTFHPKGDTSKKYMANTNTLFLLVNTPVVDTTKAFKPIIGPAQEPYTFAEIFPWIVLGLIVIGLIVFLIWYIRKRKKKQPVFARKPKPALPPDVAAIAKLDDLRLAKIWQQGKIKKYYTALTDIMRTYFEGRFLFDAMEMTSDEILAILKDKNINDEAMNKIKDVLRSADLVKFAKARPSPLENDVSLNHCVDFVKETKPVPVVNHVHPAANGPAKETVTKESN